MQTLEDFARYFVSSDFARFRAHEQVNYGSVLSLVIYRSGPWQAELFILKPGPGFPRMHRHPDVDSYEFVLSDRMPLIVNGRDVSRGRPNAGDLYAVSTSDWHGIGDVPQGGSFLSIQRWNNDVKPSSVGLNWEGTPVSLLHRALLRQPAAKWIRTRREDADPR